MDSIYWILILSFDLAKLNKTVANYKGRGSFDLNSFYLGTFGILLLTAN